MSREEVFVYDMKYNISRYSVNDHVFFFLTDEKGCSYCGGLGHRITECPKLEAIQMKETGRIGKKDYIAGSAADW